MKFNSIYFERGFDLLCISNKSTRLTIGQIYRAYRCMRYDYKKNARLADGYCVEDNTGKFNVYSTQLFQNNA